MRSVAHVLVLAHRTASAPELQEALRARSAQGPAQFHVLVPNPDVGGLLPSSIHRPDLHEGERVLADALPLLEQAVGSPVSGSVSYRHDPYDALEEELRAKHYDEVVVATLPHHLTERWHLDLSSRAGHLGLPVTKVTAARVAVSS